MTNHDHSLHTQGHEPENGGGTKLLSRGRWIFWIFAIIAAAFLISEHRAHVLGALPYVILLACPFMHMFMHGGHGGHGGHGNHGDAAGDKPARQSSSDSKE